jgi:hypothetical protein
MLIEELNDASSPIIRGRIKGAPCEALRSSFPIAQRIRKPFGVYSGLMKMFKVAKPPSKQRPDLILLRHPQPASALAPLRIFVSTPAQISDLACSAQRVKRDEINLKRVVCI